MVAIIKKMKKKEEEKERNWKEINQKFKIIKARLSIEEKKDFELLFIKSNELYESSFIKKCIFFGGADYKNAEELNKRLLESNLEIKTQLKKIGTNINQITIKLNLLKEFSIEDKKELLKEIEELKLLIYDKILK